LFHVIGKNARIRNVEILPGCYDAVFKFAHATRKRIFGTVPSHMDVHSYRREYARAFYELKAQPLEDLDRKEKYYCRKDKRDQ